MVLSLTICISQMAVAQKQGQAMLDSLLTELKLLKKDDSSKVNLLNNVAFEYNTINPDQGLYYANLGIKLSEKIKFKYGLSNCLRSAGVCYWAKSDFAMALEYYFKSLKLCEELKFKAGTVSASNNIGLVYLSNGEYSKALEYFFKALNIYIESSDKSGIAKNYQNIGNVFNKQGDYHKALDFYFKALEINEKLGLKSGIATNYGNIGKVYQLLKDFQNALSYMCRALKINEELNRKRGIMYNIGDLAETYYLIAIDSSYKNENKSPISSKTKEDKKLSKTERDKFLHLSIDYSLKAVEIGDQINAKLELIDWYQNLSKAYTGLKNWEKALIFERKSHLLKDSVFSNKSQSKITAIEFRLEKELKDKEIKFQKLELERQQIIILFTVVALILISLLAFFIYTRFRIKKKSNEILEKKNILISEQNQEISMQKDKVDLAYSNIKMLSDIGKKITAKLTAESITETVYHSVSKLMNSTVFGIGIYNSETNRLEFTGGKELNETLPFFYYDISDENRLAVQCFNRQIVIKIADYMIECTNYLSQIPDPKAGKNTESLIYMPLNTKSKRIGVISVQSFEKDAYTEYHMNILKNLSIYVAIALDNADAYKHIEAQSINIENQMKILEEQSKEISIKNYQLTELNESKDKYLNTLTSELELAGNHVKSLIPKPIDTPPIQTYWIYEPSSQIGGDSFGYHWIDAENFALYLFDVSGHGIGAALHSVSILNNLKYQTLPNANFLSPKDVLTKLNSIYKMKNHNNLFFTIWYGVFNIKTNILSFSSAGHPAALYITESGSSMQLMESNPLIGAIDKYNFLEKEIPCERNSLIYVYSDGVFEIIKSDKSIWNQSDLNEYLLSNENKSYGSDIENLFNHVKNIHGSQHLDDDFSILKVRIS